MEKSVIHFTSEYGGNLKEMCANKLQVNIEKVSSFLVLLRVVAALVNWCAAQKDHLGSQTKDQDQKSLTGHKVPKDNTSQRDNQIK